MCRFLGWFFPARDNLFPDHMFEKALYFGGCLGFRRNNCKRVGKHLDLRLKACAKSTRGENKDINGSGKDRINDLTLTISNSLEKYLVVFYSLLYKKNLVGYCFDRMQPPKALWDKRVFSFDSPTANPRS